MKLLRKLLCSAAALCILCAAAAPAALADDGSDGRFDGKTWEEVVDQYIADCGIDTYRVSLGYCNLVTGEEHYYNADQNMIGASLYKVPLNMYFNDLVADGTIDWDTVIGYGDSSYEYLMQETIINSNNEMAGTLMSYMGGYQALRTLICPYLGLDAATVDASYLQGEYYTARQIICCLRQLYDGSDRYSRIIDCMKQAEPNNYFKFNTQEYEVAHKYGFLSDALHEYVNDCAIVYTDEPIAIVMFSDGLTGGYDTMSQYCTLMSGYAQYSTAQRLAAEAQEKADAKTAEREAAAAAAPEPIVITQSDAPSFGAGSVVALALCALAAAAALVFVIKAGRAGRLNTLWGVLAVLLALAALLLCVVGSAVGTFAAEPEGDPQQTVTEFFDALEAGDYESAYACLENCDSLGLENSSTTQTGELVRDALRQSYSYELYGDCVRSKTTAYQQLRFDYLDLAGLEGEMQDETVSALRKLVQSKPRDEIYDENDEYLPEITEEAYRQALTKLLSNAEAYYTTTWLTVELQYSDGRWLIVTDSDMLKALIGGVAY